MLAACSAPAPAALPTAVAWPTTPAGLATGGAGLNGVTEEAAAEFAAY